MQGANYEIVLVDSEGPKISYVGNVTKATEDSVTLNNVVKRLEVFNSPTIPIVGKWFVNKSVGGKLLDGPVTVARSKIAEIVAE